jgi:hypothetical protein
LDKNCRRENEGFLAVITTKFKRLCIVTYNILYFFYESAHRSVAISKKIIVLLKF